MENIKKIHFVGVGGVAMGTFAVALAEYGYEVTGSDNALYEPMKGVLAGVKIAVTEGFKAETVERLKPDLVVIGNVTRKDNPEAAAWIRSGTRFLSLPEAVRVFVIQNKKSLVCAGTHGKTTTSAWTSFLLQELGMNPSYLIGGVPRDLDRGCKLTDSDVFVCEGDEYDSAFFDKGPKFLHYHPHFLLLLNIEFDHADIYRDLKHVQSSFEKLVALLPGDGLCIARYEDAVVMETIEGAICPVQTFGTSPAAMWRIGKLAEDENGFDFELVYKNKSVGNFRSPQFGMHNLLNLTAGIVAAVNLGASIDKIRPIVERFRGARRRQEILMKDPIVLVDDFAHHPTEVKATLKAVRQRFPEGKLWALFEPRSATARRSVHQDEYAAAFDSADEVLVSTPIRQAELKDGEKLSTDVLVEALLARGKSAASFSKSQDIVEKVVTGRTQRDVVVVMSNGEFDKIQEKLVKAFS